MVGNAADPSRTARPQPPLVARPQPTSPPAPLQGRCVPLLSTPLPIPCRRDGLVTALSSHEGWGTAQRGEGSRSDRSWVCVEHAYSRKPRNAQLEGIGAVRVHRSRGEAPAPSGRRPSATAWCHIEMRAVHTGQCTPCTSHSGSDHAANEHVRRAIVWAGQDARQCALSHPSMTHNTRQCGSMTVAFAVC